MSFLLLILIVFPGLFVFSVMTNREQYSLVWKTILAIIISIGFNGWIFTILRDARIFLYPVTVVYISLAWVLTILYIFYLKFSLYHSFKSSHFFAPAASTLAPPRHTPGNTHDDATQMNATNSNAIHNLRPFVAHEINLLS